MTLEYTQDMEIMWNQ